MSKRSQHLYEFGQFRLHAGERLLLRDGVPVPLQAKAFDTLLVLVENGGRLVEKDDLMKAIWPDSFVEEVNLSANISLLRKALGDRKNGHPPQYIETVPKRGYRFIAPVVEVSGERAAGAELIVERRRSAEIITEELEELVSPDSQPGLEASSTVEGSRKIVRVPAISPAPQPNPKTRRHVMLAAVVLAALAAASSYIWMRNRDGRAPANASMKSIAVLPIKNLTGDVDNDFLADGLTESLMTELSKVHGLKVISHASTFAFKNREAEPREIADRLGVASLLQGSLRRDGNVIRVETRLVNPSNGEVMWSETYERELEGIITVQDGIACNVASELEATLCGRQDRVPQRYAENIKAYQAYMKGRFYWYQRGDEPLKKALAAFNESLRHDPNYALAYAGLAETYVLQEVNTLVPPGTALPQAIANAEKALQLDPNLAGAYSALGLARYSERKFEEAEKMYRRAVEVNPNYATAWQWQSALFSIQGKLSETEFALKKALELDPLSVPINFALGDTYFYQQNYERVLEQAERIFNLSPENQFAYHLRAVAFEALGRYDEAFAAAAKAPPHSVPFLKAYILARAGRRDEALRMALEMESVEAGASRNPYRIAAIYALLGEKDKAFFWLEKAYALRQPFLNSLKIETRFDSLRSDPRYDDLLKRINTAY